MRVIGLDYGTKTCGVALSDESKQKVLNSLAQDQNLIDESGVNSHLTNIEQILNQIQNNTSVDDQKMNELKNKYGTDSDGNIQFDEESAKAKGISKQQMEEDQKFADKYLKNKEAEMDASTKAASELCKGQGLHLYGPSLGIRSSLVAWQLMIQHCHCCVLGHWCGARSIPGPRTKTNKQKRKKESMKAGEK